MNKEIKQYIKKEDDTMAATTRNYVYEIKVNQKNQKNEKTISKSLLAMCKEVSSKYPKR